MDQTDEVDDLSEQMRQMTLNPPNKKTSDKRSKTTISIKRRSSNDTDDELTIKISRDATVILEDSSGSEIPDAIINKMT